MKRLAAFALAGAMVIGTCTTAFADDSAAATEYSNLGGYTTAKTTSDTNYGKATATAHRAAAPLVDMLGANLTSSFGAINGGAPAATDDDPDNDAEEILAVANTKLALKVWATNKNSQPDPYFVNYYYNFYADVMGLGHAGYALINDNRAGSPIKADPQTTSLSTRPQVVIGVSSSNDPTDMHGYDSQLATINTGLTSSDPGYYNPTLVAYDPTDLDSMITTVTNAATAIYNTHSYRYGDPRTIADKYEQYVQGIQGYIVKQQNTIDENTQAPQMQTKKIAIVSAYNATTGKFTIVGQGATSATSADRLVEYTSKICENVMDNEDIVLNEDEVSADVPASVLNGADWIISENSTVDEQLTGTNKTTHQITVADDNILLSTERPDTLYGITMNSVENAMGLAFYAAKIYGNDSDATDPLNGWNLMRYFYCVFWHVNDNELISNTGLLYDALNNEFAIQTTINVTNLESKLAEGESYYDANLAN